MEVPPQGDTNDHVVVDTKVSTQADTKLSVHTDEGFPRWSGDHTLLVGLQIMWHLDYEEMHKYFILSFFIYY